jgi:soluble lytic murein transglycosylase-like protein
MRRTIALCLLALIATEQPGSAVERQPEQDEAVQPKPLHPKAIQSKPVQSKTAIPIRSKPLQLQPVLTEPAKAPPAAAKPVQVQPAEAQPVQAQPVQAKAVSALPVQVQAKPVQAQPAQAQSAQGKSIQAPPVQAQAVQAKAAQPQSIQLQPATLQPAETKPVDTTAIQIPPAQDFKAPSSIRAKLTEEREAIEALIVQHAKVHSLPEALVRLVIRRESNFNPRAAYRGNYGLMQIRLGTARALGYRGDADGLLDPATNMTYAMPYLAGAYRAAHGDEARTLVLYSRGYHDIH